MGAESPRQLEKREALVDAAAQVLRREGLAGCTARAISDASPLTKSALHYYFDHVDEIIELAFERVIEAGLARVEGAAEAHDDPLDALWAAARAFLGLGGDRVGQVVMLWVEAQAEAARTQRFQRVRRDLAARGRELFVRLARRLRWEEPERRASVFHSALTGAVMRRSAEELEPEAFLYDLASVMGIAPPLVCNFRFKRKQ